MVPTCSAVGAQHTEKDHPMRIILAASAAALILAQAASAQSPSSSQTHSSSSNQPLTSTAGQGTTQAQQPIREQLQKNLQSAGFTDIKMMPSSFLVRAKDPNGNPVMMVINPDSVAAVVESPSAQHQGSTTGSGTTNQRSNPAQR
jgi:hypothetical protein